MKISIITPSLNSEKTIHNTILAVLGQTFDDFEYIIVDGKSTDNTVKIANSYIKDFEKKGISYRVFSEKDNGIYHAINKGIGQCNGEIIGIINSDDWYEPNALSCAWQAYEQTNFDALYADLKVHKSNGSFVKKAKYCKDKFSTRHWNHPTMFVKKTVYDKILYAGKSIYDDLDFILCLREKGYKISVLNCTLANFRTRGISSTKSWKQRGQRIALRNAIFASHNCQNYKFENWLIETAKYLFG